MRLGFCCRLLALALAVGTPCLGQREPAIPKELRERVGEWAERYPAEIPNYTAVETVELVKWDKKGRGEVQRRLTFHYTLRRSPDKPRELVELREAVRETPREGRSGGKVGTSHEDFGAGNFSKLALLVTRLATRHHEKMNYFFAPDNSETASEHVIIGYRQVSGPGLMEVDGETVYPRGLAWVDPEDGKVTRIQEEFEHKNTRYWIEVEFGRDAELKGWVPVRIVVRLFEKGRLELETGYSYSEFRRLEPASAQATSPSKNE